CSCAQRHATTAIPAPAMGATKYSQSALKWPDTTAGASDRAGFIEAPQIGPANIASSPITEPTAIPAVIPFSLAPVETFRITNIRIALRINSSTNDCVADPAGSVAPNVASLGKRSRRTPLAANAPAH